MGREVEAVLDGRGHEITARIDPVQEDADARECSPEMAAEADVAIEFALGPGVVSNAEMYAAAGCSAVVGSTGWDDRRETVRQLVEQNGKIGYIWGSNFSMGAHILFALTEELARIADKLPEYDIFVSEIHHTKKKDSPSGTALRIGERILNNTERKKKIVTERLDRKIEAEELHIASVRGGSVPGTHTVYLDSSSDTIELRHTARNRSGFALGAVLAAEWIEGKQGFFQVEDFINDFL